MKNKIESIIQKLPALDMLADSVYVWDMDANLVYANRNAYESRGYTESEVYQNGISGLVPPDIASRAKELLGVLREKKHLTVESHHRRKDGTYIPVEVRSRLIHFNGECLAISVARDISAQKFNEKKSAFARQLLIITNESSKLNPTLNKLVDTIKTFTGCAAVGIRMADPHGNIPYLAWNGFTDDFYKLENLLSLQSDHCMCINVIKGTTDCKKSFYTDYGSFYIGAMSKFLATVSEEEKGATRNICNQTGYESVALIPITNRKKIIGLIHIADPKENVIHLEMVDMLERTAIHIGTAVQRIAIEQELENHRQNLESLVKSRTTELQELNIKLEKQVLECTRIKDALVLEQDQIQKLASFPFYNPSPVVELTKKGQVVYINPIGEKMFPELMHQGLEHPFLIDWPSINVHIRGDQSRPLVRTVAVGDIILQQSIICIGDKVRIYSTDISDLKNVQIELRDKNKRIQHLIQDYIHTQEEERQLISIEIHDRITQELISIYEELRNFLKSQKRLVHADDLKTVTASLKKAIQETRHLMLTLYPPALEKFGLINLLEQELADLETNINCHSHLIVALSNGLPRDYEVVIYRILHEALSNIRRHGNQVSNIVVSIKENNDLIELLISDDGKSGNIDLVEMESRPGGIMGMKYRTELLGGSFNIESNSERGTRIEIVIPKNDKD